jgi:DNA processing protein
VTVLDAEFPQALAETGGRPPVLTIRGRLPEGPAVAVVGSRRGDVYGRGAAERFARYLAAAGVAVVSGLARGIDAAAHRGALSGRGGSTIAILGCGMGVDYPRGHAALAAAIAAQGAVVSQFPCGAGPRPWRFPVRNRVIAALSEATLVVQATPRSGALTTARQAGEMGRLVFALPGPAFDPLSWGPHALLRSGARLAAHPEDILEAILEARCRNARRHGEDSAPEPDGPAAVVLGALARRSARTAEQVAARAAIAPQTALAALLDLEVAGAVERLPGMAYRLARPRRDRPPPAGAARKV